jgi:hypothetical protein
MFARNCRRHASPDFSPVEQAAPMIDAQQTAFLQSEAGAQLLAAASALTGDLISRLTTLRRTWTAEQAGAALTVLQLRERARSRFSRADQMFFTPEGLEQSSGERVARWRAAQFPTGAAVLDLCCGCGGDALALGGRGLTAAFDVCPVAARCARWNARVYGVGETVSVACVDVTCLRLKADAAFLDPSRRKDGRRLRDAQQYSPPLSFLETVRAAIPNLAVKVSPALEDSVLEATGGRVQFVSERGECKEAILWFGEIGPNAARSAAVLGGAGFDRIDAHILTADPDLPPLKVALPRAWLYEPDPAVIRAHLLPEVAAVLRADLLAPQIAYLTSDNEVATPFATGYRLLAQMPYHRKRVKAWLRQMGAKLTAVKRRGVALEPLQVQRDLQTEGDRPIALILTRIGGHPFALLCDPPTGGAVSFSYGGGGPDGE